MSVPLMNESSVTCRLARVSERAVVERACGDAALRLALLEDAPLTLAQEFGTCLSQGEAVIVMTDTPNTLFFVLPEPPQANASDEVLLAAARSWVSERCESLLDPHSSACLIVRCWKDELLRAELIANPKAVLSREYESVLPSDLSIEVLVETAKTAYVVLPASVASNNPKMSESFWVRAATTTPHPDDPLDPIVPGTDVTPSCTQLAAGCTSSCGPNWPTCNS